MLKIQIIQQYKIQKYYNNNTNKQIQISKNIPDIIQIFNKKYQNKNTEYQNKNTKQC